MKKHFVLFVFSIALVVNLVGKQKLKTNLQSIFSKEFIDVGSDENNLLFQYQAYKKLIQDSFLDELIIESGLEPNEETRMFFFITLSREIQAVIKKSFSDFVQRNYVENNSVGFDPNLFLQAEMSRNLSSVFASMNSRLEQKKEFKLRHILFGGLFLYFISKFNVVTGVIKSSYNYMKARDNIEGTASKFVRGVDFVVANVKNISRKVASGLGMQVDYSDVKSAEEFFKFYNYFGRFLASKKDFVMNKAHNYKSIVVNYTDDDGRPLRRQFTRDDSLNLD